MSAPVQPASDTKSADRLCVAIDAGGVLLKKSSRKDRSAEEDRSRFPIDGAVEYLTQLKKDTNCQLVLISFASRKTAEINRKDIELHFSGLFDKLYFVKNKLEKVAVCQYVGADVMIDDKAEVLFNVKNGIYVGKPKTVAGIPTIERILFTGDDREGVNRGNENTDGATILNNWKDVYNHCCKVKHTHKEQPSVNIAKYVYPEFSSK